MTWSFNRYQPELSPLIQQTCCKRSLKFIIQRARSYRNRKRTLFTLARSDSRYFVGADALWIVSVSECSVVRLLKRPTPEHWHFTELFPPADELRVSRLNLRE
jgi:hypothetical protein